MRVQSYLTLCNPEDCVACQVLLPVRFSTQEYWRVAISCSRGSSQSRDWTRVPDGLAVKNLPAMQEPQELKVWSLGGEDPLEEAMATHSSVLAWRIPWRKEPGRFQSMGWRRVGHDCSDLARISALAGRFFTTEPPGKPGGKSGVRQKEPCCSRIIEEERVVHGSENVSNQ